MLLLTAGCVQHLHPKPVAPRHPLLLPLWAGMCQQPVCTGKHADKDKSEEEPTNYLLCHSGQESNPYGPCFSALGKSKPCIPLPGAGCMQKSWW